MFKTFDLILVGAMLTAATVTYKIKHDTDNKAEEVRRLEAEIRLERDTIDLLKADRALLTQPNRLERLVNAYHEELKLEPTAPTQLARPVELPMPKSETPEAILAAEKAETERQAQLALAAEAEAKAQAEAAEAAAQEQAEAEAQAELAAQAEAAIVPDGDATDPIRDIITTGSVER